MNIDTLKSTWKSRNLYRLWLVKVLCFSVVITGLLGMQILLAEDAEVTIRQVDGRTEAVVTLKEVARADTGEKKQVQEKLEVLEEGALGVLDTSNELLAQGTDQTVETVQSVGDSAFSWLFRALDFQKERDKHKE